MKSAIRALAVVIAVLCTTYAAAEEFGVVAVGEGKCKKRDRIVVATNSGFVLAEQYSGSFDRDDEVIGQMNGYGMKDVLVNGSAGRLYIDDFYASREKAERWCFGDR